MHKNYSLSDRPGDEGKTALLGGTCNKSSPRVEAYGTVDELNSLIGLARTHCAGDEQMEKMLARVQEDLFVVGAELATVPGSAGKIAVSGELVKRLESEIGMWNAQLPPVDKFVLPGGSKLAAVLHVCRATCRRAERRIMDLHEREPVSHPVRAYVNRLSDWLYLAARMANVRSGTEEIPWNS